MKDQKTCIFHIDVNSAFLSWSAVKRLKEDPSAVDLRTIPSAVGGDVKTRHGIITAKSIPAKKYHIKTAMPVVKALELCPSLVLVPPDFETYRKYSRAFIAILREYTNKIEQVSIDEAFVDVSDLVDLNELIPDTEAVYQGEIIHALPRGTNHSSMQDRGNLLPVKPTPLSLATEIKNKIKSRLGFTVNVGISTNKLLAKMASDFEKPDKVHTLYPSEINDKMWPLPIGELYGCGGATAARLKRLGVNTIGDTASMDPALLKSILGEKAGEYISRSANGIGSTKVQLYEEDAKSYSNETTTTEDVGPDNLETSGLPIVHELSQHVSRRLRRDGIYGKTVSVSVKTDLFQRRSRQVTLKDPVQSQEAIEREAVKLFYQILTGPGGVFSEGRTIRLIGVGVSNLDHGEYHQMTLTDFLDQSDEIKRETEIAHARREKQEKLSRMTEALDQKFGKGTVRKGHK